jgi:hypothetical protein
VSVRAVCFDLLSALLDSWPVWDGVAASLGRPELGRPCGQRYLEITSTIGGYRPYLELVARAATEVGLPAEARPRTRASLGRPAAMARRGPGADFSRASPCGRDELLDHAGPGGGGQGGNPVRRVVVTAEESARVQARSRLRTAWSVSGWGVLRARFAFVAGSPFDARGALGFGFQVTWVNRLAAPVPADLAGVQTVLRPVRMDQVTEARPHCRPEPEADRCRER